MSQTESAFLAITAYLAIGCWMAFKATAFFRRVMDNPRRYPNINHDLRRHSWDSTIFWKHNTLTMAAGIVLTWPAILLIAGVLKRKGRHG